MLRFVFASLLVLGLVFSSGGIRGEDSGSEGIPLEGKAGEVASHGMKDVITWSQLREFSAPGEKKAGETLRGQELVEKIKIIRAAAAHELVDRALILQEFKSQGRVVPESLVDERVREFINKACGGDEGVFLRKLPSLGYTQERFREHESEEVAVQLMREEVAKGAATEEDAQRQQSDWLMKLRRQAYIKLF